MNEELTSIFLEKEYNESLQLVFISVPVSVQGILSDVVGPGDIYSLILPETVANN